MGSYTVPFVSLISGRKLTRMFKDACEDAQVEDLWKTFFCVSTDLATGMAFVHRSGLLSRALRASSAIPGLFPPVLGDGQVLVDGFLVDNMPAAAMRSLNRGTVIGVDVASDCHMEAYDAAIEEKSWWWFLLHGRGHGADNGPRAHVVERRSEQIAREQFGKGRGRHADRAGPRRRHRAFVQSARQGSRSWIPRRSGGI